MPGAQSGPCGCRTVSGAQSAIAQLGESAGNGGYCAEDAPNTVAAIRSRIRSMAPARAKAFLHV